MRTLCVVPARAGSTRLPRKNLAVVGGRTLVRRALETSLAAGCFVCVALSSDSDEVLAEADGLDVVQLKRPAELATADAHVSTALQHALAELDDPGAPFEAVAIVQCTSPFTSPEDVAGAVALLSSCGAEAVVSVVLGDGVRLPGDRFEPGEARNGSVFVYRREVVERGLESSDVRGYRMPAERSLDIDTAADFERALRSAD